ncbi:hypothetical protein PIIN_10102 [Serendipita indica DSM 11827]|uniref:Uncharacterized protein n=1 Tax=Serendipita indica (strain DSM 11827) TaxID=1109443 RepID=G4TXQ9_SERID|nr:hypothetical protein PIIN_10102 [Serendipita indica DSM 11827]
MSLGAAQSNPENDTQMRVSEATLMQPQRHPTALLEAPDIWEVAIGAPGSPEESLEPFFQISRLFRTHHAEGHPLPTVSTLFGLLELNLQLTVKNIRSIWGPQAESSLAELTRKHDEDLANGIQDVPRSAAIDLLRMLINGGLSLPAEKDDDLRVSPEHVYGSNRFLANRTVLVLPLISDPGRDIYKVSKLQWKKLSTGDYSWLTSDGRV